MASLRPPQKYVTSRYMSSGLEVTHRLHRGAGLHSGSYVLGLTCTASHDPLSQLPLSGKGLKINYKTQRMDREDSPSPHLVLPLSRSSESRPWVRYHWLFIRLFLM